MRLLPGHQLGDRVCAIDVPGVPIGSRGVVVGVVAPVAGKVGIVRR